MNIVPRTQWAGDIPTSGVPSRIGLPAPRLWLHHGASGLSTVTTARAYARYHIRTLGWTDVGYSFLVAEGKVLEGRGPGRQGAHTSGDNSSSHGIVVCGNYTRTDPASRDIDALRWLLSHGHRQGWWPSPTFTGGHRDAPGASTSCPGVRLHRRLSDINRPSQEDDMTPKQAEMLEHLHSHITDSTRSGGLRNRVTDTQARVRALEVEVAAIRSRVGVDEAKLAADVADRLGEKLDVIGRELGKASTDLVAEDIVEAYIKRLAATVDT